MCVCVRVCVFVYVFVCLNMHMCGGKGLEFNVPMVEIGTLVLWAPLRRRDEELQPLLRSGCMYALNESICIIDVSSFDSGPQ